MDEAQEIKGQQRGEESRIALLDAGVELLNEQSLDVILSARAVARRAERSTGSFFHYWKTTDDYISDLLEHVLRPGSVSQVEEMGSMLEQLADDRAQPVAFLRAICEQDFLNTINDPLLPVQMLLWSRHTDPRVRQTLARFYDWTDEISVSSYQLLTAAWHRKARDPFDLDTYAVVLTALLEGLAIRHLVQPHRVPISLLGQIALALIPILTAAENDNLTLDEIVTEIRHYPDTT